MDKWRGLIVTQEKILEYLKAEERLCKDFISSSTDVARVVEFVVAHNYISELITIIENYDNDEIYQEMVDTKIELFNKVSRVG